MIKDNLDIDDSTDKIISNDMESSYKPGHRLPKIIEEEKGFEFKKKRGKLVKR